MVLKCGDRVRVKMNDRYHNPLYGTVVKVFGSAISVNCDTELDGYLYGVGDNRDKILFPKWMIELIKG